MSASSRTDRSRVKTRGGYSSSSRLASELKQPPKGPAPGAQPSKKGDQSRKSN